MRFIVAVDLPIERPTWDTHPGPDRAIRDLGERIVAAIDQVQIPMFVPLAQLVPYHPYAPIAECGPAASIHAVTLSASVIGVAP